MNECDGASLPPLGADLWERRWEEEEAAFLFREAERIDTPRNRPLHVDICPPLLGGCLSAGRIKLSRSIAAPGPSDAHVPGSRPSRPLILQTHHWLSC